MKIVAGEGKKKERKFGRSGGGSGGAGVRGSAQIFDAPTTVLNTHRTDTAHHQHNTTQHNTQRQHHTTQREIPHRVVLGKGGPSQGGPWPKKQDMSNKLSRRAAPLAKVFWGQGWFAKVWAQNGLIKKEAKRRCGPKVVRANSGQKNQKNMEKTNQKKIPLLFTKNKNEMKNERRMMTNDLFLEPKSRTSNIKRHTDQE